MHNIFKHLKPNRKMFGGDPLGYSALAWKKWCIFRTAAGYPTDPEKPATSEDLKSPLLWLLQARALSETAVTVIKGEPAFEAMPEPLKSICDSQYCAVCLMLVGYSLEVCLKAMLIMKNGISGYTQMEEKIRHHRLEELVEFIPDLSEKDKAILKGLTHFVYWAGRYPDPGSGRDGKLEEIFLLSEKHKITAEDLFILSNMSILMTIYISGESSANT